MLVGTEHRRGRRPPADRPRRARPAAARERQPLRVVMGERDLAREPSGSSTTRPRRCTCAPATPRPRWPTLFARDRQHVFLEGGPTLAAAFLRAGLVDEIVAYVAPMLLGAGQQAVGRPRESPPSPHALRPAVTDVTVLDGLDGEQPNVRLTMHHQEEKLMFTGIIKEVGAVVAVAGHGDAPADPARPAVLAGLGPGGSIAVNGAA